MGTAMAANLAAVGYSVTAYVRRPEQVNQLQALGLATTLSTRDLRHFRRHEVVVRLAARVLLRHAPHCGLRARLRCRARRE